MAQLYEATNESIASVLSGLDPQENDSCLSICGSGDIPFALVEHVNNVIAVDKNPVQWAYAQERKAGLERGERTSFLLPPADGLWQTEFYDERCLYFCEDGRLDRIKRRLPRLDIVLSDIVDYLSTCDGLFSKIYLSNALSFIELDARERLCDLLVEHTLPGGIIYHANESRTRELIENDAFRYDRTLTSLARNPEHEEYWKPVVFRRA